MRQRPLPYLYFALSVCLPAVSDSLLEAPVPEHGGAQHDLDAHMRRKAQLESEIVSLQNEALDDRKGAIVKSYERDALALQTENARLVEKIAAELSAQVKKGDPTPSALLILAYRQFEAEENRFLGDEGEKPATAGPLFQVTRQVCEQVIRQFPEYEYLDRAYYLLGIVEAYSDHAQAARQSWTTLVEKYPRSALRDETLFRLGNDYFDARDYAKALWAYGEIEKAHESAYYDKALYKTAWIYYITNRFDEALQYFTRVLDFGQNKKGGSILKAEAERYLAICFADHDGRSDEESTGASAVVFARGYFESIGPRPYERRVFIHLADVLSKLSKYSGAEQAYLTASSLTPSSLDSPAAHAQLLKMYEDAGQRDDVLRVRGEIARLFKPGTPWYIQAAARSDGGALLTTDTLVQESLLALALYDHHRAKQLSESDRGEEALPLFRAASEKYAEYIRLYPQDNALDQKIYFLAEALFDSRWYRESAQAFEQVRDWPWTTEFRSQATTNAVYAYLKEIEKEQRLGRLPAYEMATLSPSDRGVDSGPLPKLLSDFVAAVDKSVATEPGLAEAPTFLFETAVVFYRAGQMDKVLERLELLMSSYPQTEPARVLASVVLEAELAKGNWADAAKTANRFKMANLGNAQGDFHKIELGARFKMASQQFNEAEKLLEEKKLSLAREQFGHAADLYLQLLTDDPKAEYADKMLYNAIISLDMARRHDAADELFNRLQKEYPSSSLAEAALLSRAVKREQTLEIESAAQAYAQFAHRFPKSLNAAQAHLNAAILFESNQDFKKAAQTFEEFSRQYEGRPESSDALIAAATLYGKLDDEANQARVLTAFIKKYRVTATKIPAVIEATTLLGDLYREKARKTKQVVDRKHWSQQSEKAYKDAVSLFSSHPVPRAAYFAAKADFLLLESERQQFEDLRIDSKNGKEQGRQLTVKTAKLSALKKRYEAIVRQYDESEWTIAAVYRIGALYDGLFVALLAAPCPGDVAKIGEDACDEYRSLLEDKAYVIEGKAVEAYKLAMEKGRAVPGAQAWVFEAAAAAHRLKPTQFPVADKPIAYPIEAEIHPVVAANDLPKSPELSGRMSREQPAKEDVADVPQAAEELHHAAQ